MCSKRCFSKKEASNALKDIQRHYQHRQHRKEKRIYYCDVCNCWHLSSKELIVNVEFTPMKEWEDILKKGELINE